MSKQTLTIQEIIKIINDLYEDRSGYVAYTPEQIKKYSKDKIQLTYGEILPESLNEIIKSLNLQENDVFYDLGAGTGKVALQVFLTTPIKKSYGIEAFEPRHLIAKKIYQQIEKKYHNFFNYDTALNSINNNFLKHDLQNATVIFTDSLCFSDDTMKQLEHKFKKIPKLKNVVSLRKINSDLLKLRDTSQLEFSWSKGSPTTVYTYSNKNLI